MNFIPYGRQDVSRADIDAVTEVLRSEWLTQGPAIEKFEKAMASYTGAKYAVAVSNATAALHIACLVAKLGKGDLLWTSPNTFLASANCGLYCGARVDFVDINPKTYNMDVGQLKKKLEATKASGGQLPKVVIPVHFAGQSCEMKAIHELAKQYSFAVIEDASHAVGGSYEGRKIGSVSYAEMAVFSFHPVKIITTGEGGMVLTNSDDLYNKLVLLRSHGMTRNPALMEGTSEGPWYYEQIDLGFNYRITDIQAALGFSQLQRIDEWVSRRHALVKRYNEALSGLPIVLPWRHPDTYSAYHLYVILIDSAKAGKSRKEVFEAMRAAEIGVNVHYIPVHTQPHYRKFGFKFGDFPEAERYYSGAISLPMYSGLSDVDQDRVIAVLKKILKT